jgi:hypothetical protein
MTCFLFLIFLIWFAVYLWRTFSIAYDQEEQRNHLNAQRHFEALRHKEAQTIIINRRLTDD